MKIIITGHSGFLGQHIVQSLSQNEIITIGRNKSNIIADLSKEIPLNVPPSDLVIHVAGKAHSVPKNDAENKEFFAVNVIGTENLLSGLEANLPKSFIFISSIAVYGVEKGENIDEDHPLNAADAYGKSKIIAEEVVQKWCKEKKIKCTILRLPLLIGKNAPGNLGAMVKGIKKGYYLNIAGGKAKKSMVLASDVAEIMLSAAEIEGIYNLTDGYHPTFFELSNAIANKFGKSNPINVPKWTLAPFAKIGDLVGNSFPLNSNKLNKITSSLTFNDKKIRDKLIWKPKSVLLDDWISG